MVHRQRATLQSVQMGQYLVKTVTASTANAQKNRDALVRQRLVTLSPVGLQDDRGSILESVLEKEPNRDQDPPLHQQPNPLRYH